MGVGVCVGVGVGVDAKDVEQRNSQWQHFISCNMCMHAYLYAVYHFVCTILKQ